MEQDASGKYRYSSVKNIKSTQGEDGNDEGFWLYVSKAVDEYPHVITEEKVVELVWERSQVLAKVKLLGLAFSFKSVSDWQTVHGRRRGACVELWNPASGPALFDILRDKGLEVKMTKEIAETVKAAARERGATEPGLRKRTYVEACSTTLVASIEGELGEMKYAVIAATDKKVLEKGEWMKPLAVATVTKKEYAVFTTPPSDALALHTFTANMQAYPVIAAFHDEDIQWFVDKERIREHFDSLGTHCLIKYHDHAKHIVKLKAEEEKQAVKKSKKQRRHGSKAEHALSTISTTAAAGGSTAFHHDDRDGFATIKDSGDDAAKALARKEKERERKKLQKMNKKLVQRLEKETAAADEGLQQDPAAEGGGEDSSTPPADSNQNQDEANSRATANAVAKLVDQLEGTYLAVKEVDDGREAKDKVEGNGSSSGGTRMRDDLAHADWSIED